MATVRPRRAKQIDKKNEKLTGETKKATRKSAMTKGSRGSRHSQVPLLDMLAEVASATLQNDLDLNSRKKSRKKGGGASEKHTSSASSSPNRKLSNQAELLNLDQIRVLSDKMLLDMFAEMTSDEIRRQYSYKCFLVPEKCSETFKSFGSENRARLQMKSHLLTHIAELLAEANNRDSFTTRAQKAAKFVAEPVQARTKRLQDSLLKRKRKLSASSTPSAVAPSPTKKSSEGKGKSSAVKKKSGDAKKTKSNKDKREEAEKNKNAEYILPIIIKSEPSEESEQESEESESDDDDDDDEDEDDNNENEEEIEEEVIEQEVEQDDGNFSDTNVLAIPASDGDDVIRDVIDTREQPGHDHKYTSVLGKKRGIETVHFEYCVSSDEETPNPKKDAEPRNKSRGIMFENPQLIVATPCFPFVYVPLLPNIAQITEIKEHKPTSNQKRAGANDGSGMLRILDPSLTTKTGKAPPQKKKQTRVRKVHKIIVPEELEPDSDELNEPEPPMSLRVYQNRMEELEKQRALATINQFDHDNPGLYATNEEGNMVDLNGYHEIEVPTTEETPPPPHMTVLPPALTKFMPPDGVEESERKLALKYIRLLRTRRKEERGALICKICQNRTFTAQATLMYHYRSHAGIKPFICSICGATFTRQHSLNYHMLIHNNKSRFVCEDCGRNFRHPSHYKEHLRRHTGETPYECSDCGLRFKTRNTYKRHLKTRHGKILTAQGIVTLSLEEFYKVRTNPRKKSGGGISPKQLEEEMAAANNRKDQETQWPESMAMCLQPELSIQEIEVRHYLDNPPEAVAFQVINDVSDITDE